ncbi:helix-turn-helix transcriptional regulator [Streptacidiphilus cavernicola]|uniref:LuxR C-terminal-related transcriptional regulator n=2 Tax=Streptacidiphilus TaxID=228398 RepID=A0ABV6UI05_9ACTN
MGEVWPLTGRSEELRLINAASGGAGARGVVLSGGAGVGKTRLARAALGAASRRGAAPRGGAAAQSARVLPLGAFGALMGTSGHDPGLVVRQASEALLAEAGRRPFLIGVDDAHRLDPLSALLVHRLVLHSRAAVVVTVRSGEPAPDAITALWKDGHLDRVEVAPLDRAATAALLEAVLGAPVDGAAADRIWDLTRGNALYLRQLVDGERGAGRLAPVDGLWRWSGRPVVSPGLAELVSTTMGELSEPLRGVVDLLALSEPLGVPLLTRLAGAEPVELAEDRGLVSVERDGRRLDVRLAHPLYGEVRRAEIGLLRARRLRGRIAEALRATGANRAEDTLRRATLTLESDLEADLALLTAAARHALELFDLDLAGRLAAAAVAAGAGFEARWTLAFCLSLLSRGDEAEDQMAPLAALAGDDGELVRCATLRANNLFWTLGEPARGTAVLDRAEAAIGAAGPRFELVAARAPFHAALGRPAPAIACAQEALASPSLSGQGTALATWGLIMALGAAGRADEIAPWAERAHVVAASSHDAANLGPILTDMRIDALRLAGLLHQAARVAEVSRERGAEAPGLSRAFDAAVQGRAALARGRLGTAVRLLREARAGLRQDTGGWAMATLIALVLALARTGDAAAAERALAELEAASHPGLLCYGPEVLLARAWVAAARGTVSEAAALARQAACRAGELDAPAAEVVALHTAVCFGDCGGAGRLAQLAAVVRGPRPRAAADHAASLLAADGDAVSMAADLFEEMGDPLAAADAAAQAAAVHAGAGRTRAARAASVRAARLAEECQGARSPALLAAARPLPLTRRERETATMAAQGLSSGEIARRLGVSIRTVEGHLYRTHAKLGTSSRAELAAFLGT